MKVPKRYLNSSIVLAVLAIAFTSFSLGPAAPQASAATICPEIRGGSLTPSDLAPNKNAIREEDKIKKLCEGTGVFAKVKCALAKLFANLSNPPDEPGELNLNDSQMPGYLRTANELTLSGDLEKRDEPSGITGGIAKMLIPSYKQDGLDPIENLVKSEGQLVTGEIILNNSTKQKEFTEEVLEAADLEAGEGYYELQVATATGAVSNYQVEGRFGEVAPLYDRYGFLKQALMPSAGKVGIPDDDCIEYDPSVIAVTEFEGANPYRDVPWTAYQYVGGTEAAEGRTVDCDVEEVDGVLIEICPDDLGDERFEVGGNLDVQSEVSLAGEAWKRIGAPSSSPGEGGVLNILLPPDTSFKTEDAEPSLSFSYDTHSDLEDYSSMATLKIADLGNVGGATSCIKYQLTAHPASAASGICEAAFGEFGGFQVVCTDEATPLDFPNDSGSAIARRGWEIVNRLYQGFWCRWNWDKDGEFSYIFDEEAYYKDPHPPYPLPPGHSGNLFWCTELVRRSHNNLSLSLRSDLMAMNGFGALESTGGPSNNRWISINDATWQNIQPGYVIFFIVPGPTDYRLNHVGIVYSASEDGITIIQSNAATKSMFIPVLDNGKVSGSVGGFQIKGFGKP